VNLEEYRAWIRHTPLPTDEQCARFAWHVMHAHSWYKVPLWRGIRFVVYLDPDLGGGFTGGRRVRDRKWYSAVGEYRDDYGRLAYGWGRSSRSERSTDYELTTVEETSSRKASISAPYPGPELPPEIVEQCGFRLFAFAHTRDFLMQGPFLGHLDGLRQIRAGGAHPHRRLLCQLDETDFCGGSRGFDHQTEVTPVWNLVATRDWRPPSLPPEIAVHPTFRPHRRLVADLRWASEQAGLSERQRECARQLSRHYRKAACLEATEALKIIRALHRLRELARG
jgi:hypothetical protein